MALCSPLFPRTEHMPLWLRFPWRFSVFLFFTVSKLEISEGRSFLLGIPRTAEAAECQKQEPSVDA